MANKILRKKAFVCNEEGIFCSHCGRKMMRDFYNASKHMQECKYKSTDIDDKVIYEDEPSAYAFNVEADTLFLYICALQFQGRAITHDGFRDAKWIVLYKAALSLKEVKIKEKGMGTLEKWVSEMEGMECLNAENPEHIIQDAFHIPGFRTYETFLQLYKEGKYLQREIIPDDILEEILAEPEDVMDYMKFIRDNKDKNYYHCENVCYQEENFLKVRTYTQEHCVTFLVGKQYFRSNGYLNMKELLNKEAVCKIEENCSNEMLKQYLQEGGNNLAYPLLTGFYDKQLESLVKWGCLTLAENYETLLAHNKGFIKSSENTPVDVFGLPVKVLKKITKDALKCQNVLRTIFVVHKKKSNLVQLDRISGAVVRFYENNIIQKTEDVFPLYKQLSKKDKKKLMTYLGKMEEDSYYLYVDYLILCMENGEEYEVFPENLHMAHNRVWYLVRKKRMIVDPQKFMEVVHEKGYLRLTTEKEQEEAYLKEASYMILAPEKREDLAAESDALKHCVRMYDQKVARKVTQIYFLRKREEPEVPYVTIEVKDNQVKQVKAAWNAKANMDTQRFVKKWAAIKGLEVNTMDLY